MASARGGLYRPREPCASPLWQCAMRHGKELREAGRLRRAVEEQVIERFIECGDPHHGFARIYCDACGHNYLLARTHARPATSARVATRSACCSTASGVQEKEMRYDANTAWAQLERDPATAGTYRNEAFTAAQDLEVSSASRALAQTAVRVSAGTEPLAQLTTACSPPSQTACCGRAGCGGETQ